METKQIVLPEGWEVDKIENGKVILKESKNDLPNSWEEYCNNALKGDKYYINHYSAIHKIVASNKNTLHPLCDKNIISSESRAKAFIALMQLVNLHDEYVKDFKFDDWENGYYCISIGYREKILIFQSFLSRLLCFPNKELATKFYNNFKDLIETAEEFL